VARRLFVLAALVVSSALAVPAVARAASGPTGVAPLDRGIEQFQRGLAAGCRTPLREAPDPAAPEACAPIDGRAISEAQMQAYEASWTHRALSLQRGLDDNVALDQQQLPHTHNSFNANSYKLGSTSYYPTVTNQDPNQAYSLTDQLRMDIRALEIDLHWWPSPFGNAATGGKWVTMCHGDSGQAQGYVHIGCSWDRPFQDGLTELRTWLDAHKDQTILLYLENQLLDQNGYNHQAQDLAARLIDEGLGSRVYRPTGAAGSTCADLPIDLTRAQMRAAGAQVLLVGNCGVGGAWGSWVHEREPYWDEHGNPSTYGDTDCTADRNAHANGRVFRRVFEDSTWLTAELNGGKNDLSTPETVARMTRCGVNIMGLDQLTPQDPRLKSLVWSWAENQPAANAGTCAHQGSDGRFYNADCSAKKHFACVDGAGGWQVTSGTGKWDKVNDKCSTEFPGSHFGVPANGLQNQLLVEAKQRSGHDDVWLNYSLGS